MAATQQFWQIEGGKAVSRRLDGPLELPLADQPDDAAPCALLIPIKPHDEAIAALIVPDDFPSQIALGGVLLDAGLHAVTHAAQLDIDGASYWVSIELLPEDDQYDPDRHGAGQRCAVTRRPLEIDAPVTLCPGTATNPCTAIYKRAVWQKALADPKPFRCPFCKYVPGAPMWKPAVARRSDRLERLLQLIAQEEPTP
jgi:hypothetical protein